MSTSFVKKIAKKRGDFRAARRATLMEGTRLALPIDIGCARG